MPRKRISNTKSFSKKKSKSVWIRTLGRWQDVYQSLCQKDAEECSRNLDFEPISIYSAVLIIS